MFNHKSTIAKTSLFALMLSVAASSANANTASEYFNNDDLSQELNSFVNVELSDSFVETQNATKAKAADHKIATFNIEEAAHLARLAELCYVQPTGENNFTEEKIAKHTRRKSEIAQLIKKSQEVYFFGSDTDFNHHENMGMVLVENDGQVRVCYHGSDAGQNWKDDFKLLYAIDPATGHRVHSGFLQHFYYSKNRVVDILKHIAGKRNQTLSQLSKDTTFVGHSLGASVAQVSAHAFAIEFGMVDSRVAAFAPCRSMDATTAFNYDQILGSRTVSFMQKWDPVTYGHFASIFGSAHVGQKVYVDKEEYGVKNFHVMREYIKAIDAWKNDPENIENNYKVAAKYSLNPLKMAGKVVPMVRKAFNYYVENPLAKWWYYDETKTEPVPEIANDQGHKVSDDESVERSIGKNLKKKAENREKSYRTKSVNRLIQNAHISRTDLIGKSEQDIQDLFEKVLLASTTGAKQSLMDSVKTFMTKSVSSLNPVKKKKAKNAKAQLVK